MKNDCWTPFEYKRYCYYKNIWKYKGSQNKGRKQIIIFYFTFIQSDVLIRLQQCVYCSNRANGNIFLSVGPLNVKILGASQPLSASRRYDLLCQSSGSRPPASITWWKNGKRLERTKETVSVLNNYLISIVIINYNIYISWNSNVY